MYLILPMIAVGCAVMGFWPVAAVLIGVMLIVPVLKSLYSALCYFFDEVIKWK